MLCSVRYPKGHITVVDLFAIVINQRLQFVVAADFFFCSPKRQSTFHCFLLTSYSLHFQWFLVCNTLVTMCLTKLHPISKPVSSVLKYEVDL